MRTSKKVPTSTLSRSAIAGAAVTKIGLKHAGYKVRKAFSASTKNYDTTNDQVIKNEQSHLASCNSNSQTSL